MEYKILIHKKPKELEEQVASLFWDGYKLFGGLETFVLDGDVFFTQAVYRLKK